jgi:hypothetical protein
MILAEIVVYMRKPVIPFQAPYRDDPCRFGGAGVRNRLSGRLGCTLHVTNARNAKIVEIVSIT